MTRAWRRTALGVVLISLFVAAAWAAELPSDALWRVEQSCILDRQTFGAAFPCLEVDLTAGVTRGFAVLRAPASRTHLVVMPTVRVTGVEDPTLQGDPSTIIQAAWASRHLVQEALRRPLGWNETGLAINSRLTRSQDQLHVHVDCVRQAVRQALSETRLEVPTDRWLASRFSFHGQAFWLRRVDGPSLEGVNLFRLANDIPAIRQDPGRTILAVIGIEDGAGRQGFMLLAGQSDPARGQHQPTSESLLDHACRGAA